MIKKKKDTQFEKIIRKEMKEWSKEEAIIIKILEGLEKRTLRGYDEAFYNFKIE